MLNTSHTPLVFLITWLEFFALAIPLSSCGIRIRSLTSSGSSVVAVHQGWSNVKAVGAKTPIAHATGLTTNPLSITLAWNAMTAPSGVVSGYNVYRATTPGAEDFSAPLATGIVASTPTYTDLSAVAATTYYYVVRPAVGATEYSTLESYSEIKVIAPPANMALVHRWIANLEMCTLMGRAPDPNNNYRCSYVGPGNVGGYLDSLKSILVDTNEMGCNYTPAPACGDAVNGCLGTADPGAVGVAGDVFYNRSNAVCWYNSGGTWKTSNDNTLTALERAVVATNNPGPPPLAQIDQVASSATCNAFTVTGFTGNKRLLTHREQVLASAWDSSLSDAEIITIQNGITLPTTGHCNSNSASGLTFDNLSTPADLETLPSILAWIGRSVRTGSNATQNCKSRYGIQDLVGNMAEWSSDQLNTCSAVTHTCTGMASGLDASNTDWAGFNFDGTIGPGGGANPTMWNFSAMSFSATSIQLPLGLPMVAAAPASFDSLAIGTGVGEFDPAKLHGDYFYLDTDTANGVPARGAYSGGAFYFGSASGRFHIYLGQTPARQSVSVGFRCAIPAE